MADASDVMKADCWVDAKDELMVGLMAERSVESSGF